MGEKLNRFFSETVQVYDIKVGRWSQLNEYMKLYAYQRSGSFNDLDPSHSDSIFSNFISSITTMPIKAKFHVEPPWNRGTIISSNHLDPVTNLTAMSIYGQNLSKSSSQEPKSRRPWKFVCSIGRSSTTKFVQIMILGWPWLISRQGQIWSLMLLHGKMIKQLMFRKLLQSMLSKFVDEVN